MSISDNKKTLMETPYAKITFNSKDYGFKLSDIETYLNIFTELKLKNHLKSGEFEDVKWKFYKNSGKSKECILFTFDLEIFSDFNLALKCFVLNLLENGLTFSHVRSLQSHIKQAFLESRAFDPAYLSEYKDILISTTEGKKELLITSNLRFANFYKEYWDNNYENLFKSFTLEQHKNRQLPNYEAIIQFDDILTDFMRNCTKDKRKKYFPILLWWRITKIIPLRPAEFLKLKADCVSEKNGIFTITVPRDKQKGIREIEVTSTLKITKEIYDLVSEYLTLQNTAEKSEYLMAYMSYNSFIKIEYRKAARNKRNRVDKMDKTQLYSLLNDFYINIVGEKYGFSNLERVKIGDTRHFAFCNMMLQGFNALTIARIGGHLHLKSQVNYINHLDYFAEARVRILSETIKRNRDQDLGYTYLSDTKELIVRSKLRKGEATDRRIQGGFCWDENFPKNCIPDCIFCSNFQLDLIKHPEIINNLKMKSDRYSKNIKEQIQTMQRFSIDMLYDKSSLQYSNEDQEHLLILARKLNDLFNQKAVIDSYI